MISQLDVFYLFLFVLGGSQKPFRSFIRQYKHVYFIFALPQIYIIEELQISSTLKYKKNSERILSII